MTMTEDRFDAPPLGHNKPPVQTLPERLKEDHAELVGLVDAIAARANDLPKEIGDDEQLKLVAEVGAVAAAEWANTDNARKREKDPFLNASREVDAFFKPFLERLERIKKLLAQRAAKYQDDKEAAARRLQEEAARAARAELEERRKAAEEAARAGRTDDAMDELREAEAAETALREAEAAPEVETVRTDSGVTVAGRKEWAFEIADYDAIPLSKLKPYLDREAVEKAIRSYLKFAKGDAKLEGVRFFQKSAAQFRRG